MKANSYEAVVIGSSLGGLEALGKILGTIPKSFSLPLMIVQHLAPDSTGLLPMLLAEKSPIRVNEADDKEAVKPGTAFFAPPNYHLLVGPGRTLALSIDERENYSRPSIDVLFESAAEVYGSRLIGVILTGASEDGARGLEKIKAMGGLTIVQDPGSAEGKIMPRAAIERVNVDRVLPLEQIGPFIAGCALGKEKVAV